MRRHENADEYTQLLLRAQRGDPRAFAGLYGALSPAIRDFIASLDGQLCPHECEDLAHETLLVVWQKLSEYRGEASARTFALAIAKNIALKHMSKRQRLPVIYTGDLSHVPSHEPASSRSPESDEVTRAIEKAMAQLTEAQRQAIELVRIRGMPRSEALKLASCSPNQFQKRLQRAAESLRQLLRNLPRCILL